MEANLSLYELNRSVIEQQGQLPQEEIPKKVALILDFTDDTHNQYYMLYGKEISYFTVFSKSAAYDGQSSADVLFECLVNIGPVYSIELTKSKDAIEIWVKDNTSDILTCLYFFPYDDGIVMYGEQ